MRFLTAALCCAALPALADPLPQGEFMLGTYIWPDNVFARYVTLHVEGAALAVEISGGVALNIDECDTTGACIYAANVATATAILENDILRLSDVVIDTDTPLEAANSRPVREVYTDPVLNGLTGARLTSTDTGFTLSGTAGDWHFFETDAATRDVIRTYPLAFNVSITRMAGCEIRVLAPLFADPDPSEAEARFRLALRGFALGQAFHTELAALAPMFGEPNPDETPRIDVLRIATLLPSLLASMPEDRGDPAEAAWELFGDGEFADDRAGFDAILAEYGDTLEPLIELLQHVRANDVRPSAGAACTDPSFGFLDAP
ncbi:hypothetical protein [Hasllibacter sp. MH4015]|uniref:hypothetical protein n=1 Tax=Hasllibacter sp. MH4015 TaxID=2854029 RepID=UPI001CD7969F|nr:hypothetical protein [Hasllibacter sp. MH4015]